MVKRFVPLALPATGEEEWLAVREPLLSGWVTQGPKVAAFEEAFAQRHQVEHALAVTSATTGLHLALAALGVGPGDEVIVPALTWVATANAVLYCGAAPVFVDVDPKTFNLDIGQVSSRVTGRTKAVIAVHLFGRCADVGALRAVLPEGVRVVEDAACAAGSSLDGMPAGKLGDVAVFSFHPRKSVTTGEGGMVTTDDASLAVRVSQLRNHGARVPDGFDPSRSQPYLLPDFDVLGYNYRMTDIQGAIGLVQLAKLDRLIAERSRGAEFYLEGLGTIGWLQLPNSADDSGHSWQSYVTLVDEAEAPATRNEIMQYLHEAGIGTRPGTHAVPGLSYYRQALGTLPEDYPNANRCESLSMALPLHNRMTSADFQYVISVLRSLDASMGSSAGSHRKRVKDSEAS